MSSKTNATAGLRGRAGFRKIRGVSIVETMVVSAIASVLIASGGPALNDYLATQRLRIEAMELRDAFTSARAEAIQRIAPVTVAARDGDLAKGWEMRSGSAVLRDRIGSRDVQASPGSPAVVEYYSDGRLVDPGRVTVVLSVARNPRVVPRCVKIDLDGRPSIQLDTNRDGLCSNA